MNTLISQFRDIRISSVASLSSIRSAQADSYASVFYKLTLFSSLVLHPSIALTQPNSSDTALNVRSFSPGSISLSNGDPTNEIKDSSDMAPTGSLAERAVYLNERGVELFLQGKRSQGSGKVKQALAHDPHNPNVLYNLAGLYLADGRADLALPVMRRVISLKPGELAFQDRYAESCVATRELDSAIRAYEGIEQQDSNYNQVLLKLSALYAMREQWTKAEQTIRRAHAHLGDNPRVLTNFGAILVARGKYTEAVPILTKAQLLEESGENAVALGMSYESLGENQKAIDEYTRALKLGTHDDAGLREHMNDMVGNLERDSE
jgi:Tfp pilus assembly protein PilF